jgi:hypothetical protein
MIDPYDAARAIRPHLGSLLTPPEAEALRAELDALLAEQPSPATAVRMTAALSARDATREWVRANASQGDDDVEMGYSGLRGAYQAVAAYKYVCPVEGCPRVAYVQFAGEAIDACPDHHRPLVPA